MSHLPVEVLTDLLSRLQVKPLLRFRCVSKSWLALIDSSDFVKLHLNRTIETKSNLSLVLRYKHLYSMDFESLDGAAAAEAPAVAIKLDRHPLWCQDYGTEVWGSCHGLLCLSNALDTLVLWNPSTQQSRKLPYASIEFPNLSKYRESRIYGFGYDSAGDDYKLVRIVCITNDDFFDYEVKVYSVKSNSWHRVEKFPNYALLKRIGGVLAGGALHWVVTEDPHSLKGGLIVAFDLSREEYQIVPQPEYTDSNFYMNLQELGGCLSLLCNYYLSRVDIWVMKDYGVKESWTKLISVGQPDLIRPFQFVTPIAYSKSGGKVLLEQDNRRFFWYDLNRKTIKNVRIHGIKEFVQVEMCMESLVPLNLDGESDRMKQHEQEEKNMDNFLSKGFKLVL